MFGKQLLFSAAVICLPFMMKAQVVDAVVPFVNIDLGIKAGANFQKLNGDTWKDAYRTGFTGGIFGGVKFKKFGVQGEVLLSQASFTTEGTKLYKAYGAAAAGMYNNIADSAKEGNFLVTQVNVPVMLNVKLLSTAWLLLGPQYTAVVGVKDKDGLLKDADALFKSGDISGVIGVQLNLPMKLHAGARYIIGFSDVNNTSVSNEWKNRTIQLSLGYSFL